VDTIVTPAPPEGGGHEPSRRRAPLASKGWLAALRSWAVTLALGLGLFLALTTLVGGPMAKGTPIDFRVQDIDGQVVDSEALRGRKAVLYVWATWCQACSLTTPSVDAYASAHPDVPVLAVAADDPDAVRAAIAAHPRAFRTIPDGTALARELGVHAFPTTILIDEAGRVAWNRQGVLLPFELNLRAL
jgi:thiol-disulfide isomerase/thioredoxin